VGHRMYFPPGFEIERAIELATLVTQAYAQFDAFRREAPWNLTGEYSLVKELTYVPLARIAMGRGSFLSLESRGFHLSGERARRGVPIGFVAERNRDLFLILRGTFTASEWIRNLNIDLVPYPLPEHGRVHRGFLQSYILFQDAIIESVEKGGHNRTVFVGGHSLGGAISTLAVPEIARRFPDRVPRFYSFGSPRVGDNDFVQSFNRGCLGRSFRVVNTSDIVGSIPLPAPIAGVLGGYFSHVDTPVDFTVQHDDLEKNHDMATYVSALQASREQKGLFRRLRRRMTTG
jgi:triacylglycerol lipase